MDYANPKTNVMEVMPKMTEDHDLNITGASRYNTLDIDYILILILVAGLAVFFVRRHK